MISKKTDSSTPACDIPSQKTNSVSGNFETGLPCKSKSKESSKNDPPTETRSKRHTETKTIVTTLLFIVSYDQVLTSPTTIYFLFLGDRSV